MDNINYRRAYSGIHEPLPDDTYELVGPQVGNVAKNPYKLDKHCLWRHGAMHWPDCPRTFNGIKAWFKDNVYEGIVWHHEDGRMVKIKRRDFGYKWPE